ncbi:MAG: M14 family zinc carboxypeptidase [Pseudomonadota bacterium]
MNSTHICQASRSAYNFLIRSVCACVLSLIVIEAPVSAGNPDDMRLDGYPFKKDIPWVEEAIGHDLGEMSVRYDVMMAYLRNLAKISDRVSVETIGYSHERRPIIMLTYTHPDNRAKLEAMRKRHLQAGIGSTPESPNNQTTTDDPLVLWINHGVHGDEMSGIDHAMLTAYHLVAAQGDKMEQFLKDTIVLQIATFNPDGHARNATWVNMHKSVATVTDPQHRERSTTWPGGRTNHYWFDLNRQWLLLTQPESLAWMAQYQKWRPHVVMDYHEMGRGQTYYFHPGVESRTHPMVSAETMERLDQLSRYTAKALDEAGVPYFTRERFDNFYIGKGSTYPAVSGGVGILFEQSASDGIKVETANGINSFRRNIREHHITAIATLLGAHDMAADLKSYQRAFFKEVPLLASADPVKAYVFDADGDTERLNLFIDLLDRHAIEAYRLARELTVDGERFTKGEAVIVPANQPLYRLVKGIFGRFTEFEDDSFYDISGWTLSLSYNLRVAEVGAQQFSSRAMGEPAKAFATSVPATSEDTVFYVMEAGSYYLPRATYELLDAGVRAGVMTKPVTIETANGTHDLAAGAVIIPRASAGQVDKANLDQMVTKLAKRDGLKIHAATSGLTPQGPDLGGASVTALKRPEILMIVGESVSSYAAGELWHLLDHKMHMRVSMVDTRHFDLIDPWRYTHIIMPNGRFSTLSKNARPTLARWVDDGGVLIAERRGAAAVTGFEWGLKAKLKAKEEGGTPDRQPFGQKRDARAKPLLRGAVFLSDLDLTHPLAFGYARPTLPSHKDTQVMFAAHEDPFATVAAYQGQPLASGYASDKNKTRIAGSPMAIAEIKGRGKVILLADGPDFRGTWFGTNRLLLNAILFADAIE